jgi:branched-chain amino acid aminotransferase
MNDTVASPTVASPTVASPTAASPTAADPAYANGAAWSNGRFMPAAEATISVLDWGFTRSDTTYDVVHVHGGGFFRLADHLDRFTASMARRRLAPPESRAQIEAILHRLVALTGLADAYVAMVALRGRPRIGGSRRPADCDNHFLAYALPWIDVVPPDVQARGAHLHIASTPRVPDASFDPTVKNYMWGDLTSGLMEAHDHGFDTAVLCDAQGLVTEGPGFNIFVVKDGRVMTPAHGSLQGITRRSVLELCAELGLPHAITDIPRAVLEEADEVFLATTAGGVMPVSRVGAHIMGNDRPGPLSAQIRALYWKKHAEGWHMTPVRHDTLAEIPA